MDHSFTCKQHHACLSFTRWRHHNWGSRPPIAALLLIYRPQRDKRLSWPGWLTYSGWFTHTSGHPSATNRAQDSESTSAKDQCSTAGPHHQYRDYLPWTAKMAEPIELPFAVCSRAGPRKHALHWGAHWSHLASTIWTIHVCLRCSLCQITLTTCSLTGFLFWS